MNRLKNVLYWLGQILVALLFISFITFTLINLTADDPIVMKYQELGASLDPELLETLRLEAGLDKPFIERYLIWLMAVLQGNLGESIFYGVPVSELMLDALPKTLSLVLFSTFLSALISLPLSILAAVKRNSIADYAVRLLSMFNISIPSFWVGLILLYIFALQLQLIAVTDNEGITGILLPAITLSIWTSGLYIRRLRTAILEELSKDYVIGAKALGMTFSTIMMHYILPNVLLTILPMLGITLGSMLGGATIIETIFGWHGIGYLMVQGIVTRDYMLMQGYILWAAGIFLLLNTLVELFIDYLLPTQSMKVGGSS